jgi:hypothetical protein
VTLEEFKKYKPSLLFIGLVDLLFKMLHSKVLTNDTLTPPPAYFGQSWPERFSFYIRMNDITIMEICKKVLKRFEEELIVSEDWLEMFDVLDYLEEINDPIEFVKTLLQEYS